MRSPNYPAVGLSTAVALAEKLWSTQKRSKVPLGQAVKNMGFKGPTGVTGTRVSALRKYGLIEDGGEVQLSELAINIVAPIKPEQRIQALREAASRIDLFEQLSAEHVGVDDNTLKAVLTRDGFSDSGARQAIEAYRDTLAFAAPNAGDSMPGIPGAKPKEEPEPGAKGTTDAGPSSAGPLGKPDPNVRQPASGATPMSLPLPLAPNVYATLEADFPMTESNWQRMLIVLEAFKPGLTRPDDPPGPKTGVVAPQPVLEVASEAGLTAEAEQLIAKVDSGGVPAFMNAELERIARENGVEVAADTTPNEVVEALKARL